DLLSWKGPILPPLPMERYRRSQPALLRFDAAFRRPARFEHPDTRPLKVTPDLPTSREPSSVMVGEAGDFTSLIGIPLQSPVLQQAGAFLLGRHHPHIKGRDQLINAADWRPVRRVPEHKESPGTAPGA